jgi:general stress protein YciG
MAGTRQGGRKAAEKNKERYGENFYANIGRIGGKAGHTGGFAADPELARRAGAIGGRKSKRGPAKKKEEEKEEE